MYAVDIRVNAGELSWKMSEMRMWLDAFHFEPSTFSCHDLSSGMLVSVNFREPRQAEAFAERFGGRIDQAQYPRAHISAEELVDVG